MQHELFRPKDFHEGMDSVVGGCNGFTMEERWEQETPVFARAILDLLPGGAKTVLDYGCGVGRVAKEILARNPDVTVIGVDASAVQLGLAREYVDSDRFITVQPHELDTPVDLAYSIYVLQHVPAIELRELLQRIHYYLIGEGRFVYCSSDYRMAIRFDEPHFTDDRFLGVNLQEEISRFFTLEGPLFSEEVLDEHPLVRTMVTGTSPGGHCLPHPALLYHKRFQDVPLFNYR